MTNLPKKRVFFYSSNDKQFSFARFIDSKYSNFFLYCCPKRIFLLEKGQNYSTILGLYYSKSWDFTPRSWDFVPNPGTLFQILGLCSKSWDFIPNPGTLLHHPGTLFQILGLYSTTLGLYSTTLKTCHPSLPRILRTWFI